MSLCPCQLLPRARRGQSDGGQCHCDMVWWCVTCWHCDDLRRAESRTRDMPHVETCVCVNNKHNMEGGRVPACLASCNVYYHYNLCIYCLSMEFLLTAFMFTETFSSRFYFPGLFWVFSQDDSAGAGSVNRVLHYHDKVIVVNTQRESSVLGLLEYICYLSALKPLTSKLSLFYEASVCFMWPKTQSHSDYWSWSGLSVGSVDSPTPPSQGIRL